MKIENFRNISCKIASFSQKLNAIYGDNAAGKTSLLEAIYVLATTKSFRSNQSSMMIAQDSSEFTLFCEIFHDFLVKKIGFLRNRHGVSRIHLDGEAIKSISTISLFFPVLFIGADSHRILMDGPKVRRQFLDWGLFYGKSDFLAPWRQYQKILAHRNAALKARVSREELSIWNAQLAEAGERLNDFRESYVQTFQPFFQQIIDVFFEALPVTMTYFSGWDKEISLIEALNLQFYRELAIGHTISGPHRADLLLKVNGLPVEEILSQGQQKLVSYALRLAQGVYLKAMTEKKAVFLIDDLPSELDLDNQHRVMRILQNLDCQVFVTGVHQADLVKFQQIDPESKMFHVKHGVFEEVERCFT